MTEIDALMGEALAEQCALARGWERYTTREDIRYRNRRVGAGTEMWTDRVGGVYLPQDLPRPDRDFGQAYALLQEMRGKGWDYDMGEDDDGCYVSVVKEPMHDHPWIVAEAGSGELSVAVCRAFVRWAGQRSEQ